MFKVIVGLLMVVFLLFLYGALKLASLSDKEMKKSKSEENSNGTKR